MILAPLLAVSVLSIGAPVNFANLFEACEDRYLHGQYQRESFRYRLFVPRNLDPMARYPLLVWLHGAGEAGRDNQRNLFWLKLVLDDLDHIEEYRFFILIVQSPAPSWLQRFGSANVNTGDPDDMITAAGSILWTTMRERPIDPDRVYLAGISAGGSACWEMALRHPEWFAAVVPMSSGGGDVSRAANLAKIPIWAFHNTGDRFTPPDNDIRMAAAVSASGGNIHLTLFPPFPGVWQHDSWTAALRDHGIVAWMLAQRRGAWACWTPPGTYPWQWRHIMAIPCVFFTIVGMVWHLERKRRLLKRRCVVDIGERKMPQDDLVYDVQSGGMRSGGMNGPQSRGLLTSP